MKIDLEKIYLAVFFSMILLIGPASLLGHKTSHDFPYGYLASDAFQHQVRAEAIKDIGNFKYEAPYISQGFKDAVGRYPPILPHLAAVLSVVSGLETYDAIILISFLIVISTAFIFYFIIRQSSISIAMLSLPLSLLVFSKAPFTGFLWGHWPSMLGQFFLAAFIWILLKIGLRKSYLLAAAFVSGIALGHTIVLFSLAFVLAAYMLFRIVRKELKFHEIRALFFAGIIAFAASFYYAVIFMNSWAKGNTLAFSPLAVWDGNPGFYFADFGLLAVLITAGIIFYVFNLKKLSAPASILGIISMAFLILGFGNYITFPDRAFQLRFFWPIYLSFLFGFGMYHLARAFSKSISGPHCAVMGTLLFFALAGFVKIPFILQAESFSAQGMMDSGHWEVLTWLSRNTAQDSKIYFFYGDLYSQDAVLRNSKREHQLIDPQDYAKAVNERKIRRFFLTEMPGDGGGGTVYRKSFFSFGSHQSETPAGYFFGVKDICGFDYYVFDRAAGYPAFAAYNMILASELIKKDYIKAVFENKMTIILKNLKPGGDCIEERSI